MTALAAVASLGFAAPAAAAVPQLNSPQPPTGKATIMDVEASPAGYVTVQWDPHDVQWGTGTPHEWVVDVTSPKGATLSENTCTGPIPDGGGQPLSCYFGTDTDGTYAVKVTAKAGDLLDAESATATVTVHKTLTVPGEPQNVKVLPGPNELVVSWQPPADPGSGVGGYDAVAYLGYSEDAGGVCSTTTELTCTIKGLTAGKAYTVYVDAKSKQDPQYNSYASEGIGPVKPLAPAAGTPTPPASVPSSTGKLTAPGTSVTPGKAVTLSGTGYAADAPVQIVVYSTPKVLKTVTTDHTGSFSASVTLPSGLTGSHTLVAGGVGPDGAYRYLTLPVTVSAAGTGGTGGGLPITGQSVPKLVVTALLVLAFGVVLVRVSRRRAA